MGPHSQTVKCWVGACHFDEQVYGAEMGEKDRQNGSLAVLRGISEEPSVVRNGVIVGGLFLTRAMSRSVT